MEGWVVTENSGKVEVAIFNFTERNTR